MNSHRLSKTIRNTPWVILILVLVHNSVAAGQIASQYTRPSIAAVRTESAPVINGRLDEQCWSMADVATDFTEVQYIRPAIEQTFVRVLYDDEFIYISFECLEPEPERIQATERQEDHFMRDDDRIDVRLDTFGDKRTSYAFTVNTLGTRFDARQGFFGFDENWDSDWKVVCTVGEDRWIAEMTIPIADMHFEPKKDVTWGVNFSRSEEGRQEHSSWSYLNQQPRSPRNFGTLTGLDLSKVEVEAKPKFETYLSSTAKMRQAGTGKLDGGKNELSTGLDMSMRFNSQWISAFTYNPDFGQVEADPDTIELRDTERFLPERRTFFQEGAELFETPLNYYYSRRFQDIDGGAKITGQGSKWALGMIDVIGDIKRGDEQIGGHYNVGRFVNYMGEDSHLGAVWASSNRKDGSNIVTGLDTRAFIGDNTWLSGQVLNLRDSKGVETDGDTDHSGHGMLFQVAGDKKPYSWNLSYIDITKGFVPDLGYIPRRDIRGPAGSLFYDGDIEEGPVRWVGLFTDFDYYHNHKSEVEYNYYRHMAGIRFRNELEIRYYRSDRYHHPYYNRSNRFRVSHNRVNRWNSISGSYEKGVYEGVPYDEYGFEKPVKLSDRFTTEFELDYRVQKPEEGGDETIWLWRWVTEYVWPWEGRIKFTAEDTAEGRYNLTLLFSWPVRDNIDYYFVFNDYRTEEDGIAERGVFTKIVYRF